MLQSVRSDVGYALRMLIRNRVFAAVAIASLAIGIGFNTAMFSAVDALLFRPFPVDRPERLADVYTRGGDGDKYATSSYPDFLDFRTSNDVFDDMLRFFDRSLAIARRAGIPDRHVILDPGIGFGKTWEQHLEALRRLPDLKAALPFPVLVGISRKSLLGHIHNTAVPPRDRLFGSVGAHVTAVALGADIVRVHDVRPHVEAIRVVDAVMRRAR